MPFVYVCACASMDRVYICVFYVVIMMMMIMVLCPACAVHTMHILFPKRAYLYFY